MAASGLRRPAAGMRCAGGQNPRNRVEMMRDQMPATVELDQLVELLRRKRQQEAASALERFPERFPPRALDALLKRLQVAFGHRRMSIGIYDHALHVLGGGQK